MSERTKFCPKCGKEIDKGLGPRGLCESCYKDREKLEEVPKEIKVPQCPRCKSYLHQGDWKQYHGEEELIATVLSDYSNIDQGSYQWLEEEKELKLTLKASKDVAGRELEQEIKTKLKIKHRLCPTCQKIETGYYKAVIQLRGEEGVEAEEQALNFILKEDDRNNRKQEFISRVKEVKEGYNLYLSSRKYAEKLLKVLEEAYTLEKKDSRQLVGEKDGQRIYKSVKSARILGTKNV